MNKNNLQQIFAHYTERFEELNNVDYDENFKWSAAKQFRERMDLALSKDGSEFADVMKSFVKDKITKTIVDNYTQPFAGLAELARKEPEAVKKMLLDLYADDGGDLKIREEKIRAFFIQSQKLLERYFPKSFLYKQDAHAVSAYLFLYDPDHHYLYKPTQARLFADCVEFYGDWGSGNNIKLNIFYKMCDELVEEIKKCPELLETNQSRFDGRFRVKPEEMHPDTEKHILAFDIIYCSMVYDLFKGITFKTITVKEKKLYQERLNKARELQTAYQNADGNCQKLKQAEKHYSEILVPGATVRNEAYGNGKVLSCENKIVTVKFEPTEKVVKFDYYSAVANGYLKFEDALEDETAKEYRELFKCHAEVYAAVGRYEKELEKYSDILE